MQRALTLAALLLLTACGEKGAADVELSRAWARPTVGQQPAGVYVTIDNKGDGDDRLTAASTDHAAMAMVHQSEMDNGVATMRMAGEINVPAHERIEMQPGGTHIMLEGLRAPLKAGDEFELVLRFRESGAKTVKVTVLKPEGE